MRFIDRFAEGRVAKNAALDQEILKELPFFHGTNDGTPGLRHDRVHGKIEMHRQRDELPSVSYGRVNSRLYSLQRRRLVDSLPDNDSDHRTVTLFWFKNKRG